MAVAAAPFLATTAHAALGVCDAAPLDNVEVEATAGTPGPTSYNTLGAAFAAINAGTHQGSIAIEVCGNPTEAASAVLNASGAGAALYTDISVKPVGGAARTITGTLAAPLIDLNGADNVTIDGLQTGGNSLALVNTSAAVTAGTSTIRFIGGATGNTVTRASVQGSSLVPLATAGGTIVFGTDVVAATGNDNNTISFCDIGPAGANLPIKAIFGLGTATTLGNYNSGVVIDHNNVFDFFGTGAASVSGIHVLAGNDAWTISNNRIYQTAPRVFTAAARYAAITLSSVATGGAFTVSGNTIGFGAANGTGTTTISGGANEFRGIDVPTTTNITTPTVFQNNVISGINQTTSDTGTTSSGAFVGIVLGTSDGRFNAIGNQIGSLDGSSTIVVTSSAAATSLVYGILDFSFESNTVSNNSIGSITIQGAGAVTGFRGIYWNTGAALTETVTGNTIGSAAGPIVDLQVGSNSMYGINGVAAAAIITGNTISNLSANSTSAAGPIITVGGIIEGSTSTTVASNISLNTIRALSNNAGVSTNSGAVYGMSLTLPNTLAHLVERNSVQTLSVTSTVIGYQLAGIVSGQGTTTYRNNMVSLGYDAAGNPITTGFAIFGIFDPGANPQTNNQFYFNSVYIGGSGVTASTSNSYALYSNVLTNVRNFQDNILWNTRSNAVAGGAAQFAIRIGTTTTGLTSNYNDLFANGTDGVVGVANAVLYPTLANWQTGTSLDALSLSVDPTFVAPTNLHVLSSSPMFAAGTTIAGVTDDFDGDVRPATPTIGADEPPPPVGIVSISPLSHDFGNQAIGTTSAASSITIANTGTASFNVTALTAAAAPFAQSGGTCTAVPFTLAAGTNCTLDYTFSPTAVGVANQAFTVTASAAGDTGFALSGTGTANAPTIAKSFTPSSVATATNSTVTITLSNSNAAAILLTANLDDTLPAGLVASAASTTCTGTASFTAGTLSLASGASIPVGSCTLTGTVQAATAGSYVNTIPAGALQTDAGNNAAAATDTLTVTAVTHTVTSSVGTPSGTITPLGAQTVADGATQAFTLAPAVGFHIVTTTGSCAGSLAGTTYTTGPITADCSVIANFAADVIPGTFPPDENFDEVTAPALPGGWVSAFSGAGVDWVTSTMASDTAPNSAYAAEFGAVADETLDSPTFTAVAGQTLTFRHSYNLEASATPPTTYDGAVLEISINGGAFQDILAAGGSFVSGGYNKTVSASFSNPLAGRQAWGGSSAGFVTTVVGLPAAAVGQPAILRFRTGDDSSATATAPNGWWIDTLHLGVFNPPSATVTPASLSFTAPTNGTDAHPLTIANAAGSSPLTYSIATLASRPVLRPHVQAYASKSARPAQLTAKDLIDQANRQLPSLAGVSSTSVRVASPWVPATAVLFQLDDGSVEGAVGWGVAGPPATEAGAVWINRFTATGPLTVDSVSILWRTPVTGSFVGLQPNLVVYYDAASTGDPSNATRVGIDTLVTIATQGAFETYPTNFLIPGAGDVYIGFVDQWALAGGFSPRLFPGAQDRTSSAHSSWLSAAGTPPTDINNLANNSTTGVIDDLSATLAGNWMIRATGTLGGGTCTGAVVPWLTAAPSSGSVSGGTSATVTVTANPAAGSLVEGTYTAEVCITTNDPANALIAVPVTLTVTTPPFVPCSGGADEIFCDGFEGAGGGGPGLYTDRTTFLTHVAAGSYENPFDDAVTGQITSLSYTSGTWAYTVGAATGDLYNDTGVISTNGSGTQIVVTFTGAPVTAVGGNFWATDANVAPNGLDITITLSDSTTETFTSTGPTDFRGFTTAAPITSITIDAPNPSVPTDGSWSTMDNLIIGTGN